MFSVLYEIPLFFKTQSELHPPCERKPSLITCPKQSPSPLKYNKAQGWCSVLEPFFLWAAALLHKNEKGLSVSECCREAVGFRLSQRWMRASISHGAPLGGGWLLWT